MEENWLLWGAGIYVVTIILIGLVVAPKIKANGDKVYVPTPEEFTKLEQSTITSYIITSLRCLPGITAMIFACYSDVRDSIWRMLFYGGIVWIVVVTWASLISRKSKQSRNKEEEVGDGKRSKVGLKAQLSIYGFAVCFLPPVLILHFFGSGEYGQLYAIFAALWLMVAPSVYSFFLNEIVDNIK